MPPPGSSSQPSPPNASTTSPSSDNNDNPPSSSRLSKDSEGYPSWLPKRPPPPPPASTFQSSMIGGFHDTTPSPVDGPPFLGGRKPTPRSVRMVSLEEPRTGALYGATSPKAGEDLNPMIQANKIAIHDGNFTNVGGDYHYHRNVIKPLSDLRMHFQYLKIFKDTVKNELNKLISCTKEDSKKSDSDTGQNMCYPPLRPMCSRRENQDNLDEEPNTNTCRPSKQSEIKFNSLYDPPTSEEVTNLNDESCIYQTPTPIRNRSASYSANPDSSWSNSHIWPAKNQQLNPFSYMSIMHYYVPCWSWLPSWGGWVASWAAWASPVWIWPSFL